MPLDPTNPLDVAAVSTLVLGLSLMGAGQFYKKRHRHILTALGEVLFGIFWVLQVPYYLSVNDTTYAVTCAVALLAYGYLAYHEYLCFVRSEELTPLDWVALSSVIAAGLYFIVAFIQPLDEAMVYGVAINTTWVLDLFGYHSEIHTGGYDPAEGFSVPIYHNGFEIVRIIMACTGFQSIALLFALIISTRPDRSLWKDWAKANLHHVERRLKKSTGIYKLRLIMIRSTLNRLLNRSDKMRILFSVLVTVPVIYVLNVIRNAAVVYVTGEKFLPFPFFHDYIMRIWAFMILVILILIVFELLPEMQENLFGLLDIMTKRNKFIVKGGFLVPRDDE